MPRTARIAPGGIIYHVFNRAVGKTDIFRSRKDHEAFQKCLIDAMEAVPMRVLAYCVMSNHWHLLLWPRHDGELSKFMMQLTNTHVRRWLTAHDAVGAGHLYQGRYKSSPTQSGEHLSTVARYIERNPRRAKRVTRAELWPWSSLGQAKLPAAFQIPLSPWPTARRGDWVEWVNAPQTAAEESAIKTCIDKSRPFGSDRWIATTMARLGWQEPRRPGRPRKQRDA